MTNALAGLDPCVHCGFCLQACPTYVATGDEADGPRGRIVLMQELARGRLQPTDEPLVYHLNRCLGCRACESACPSGVVYGPALEETRATLAETTRPNLIVRMVLAVMADRRLRGPLLAMSRLLRPIARVLAGPSVLGFQFAMLAATRMAVPMPDRKPGPNTQSRAGRDGAVAPPPNPETNSVAAVVFQGCIMEGLFDHVNRATERTLRANGFATVDVPTQGCCGALHAHAGMHEQAIALARQNVAAFMQRPDALVIVNSAGCGAALKDYGRLLASDVVASEARRFSARVKDINEILAAAGPRSGAPLEITVAFDPPCHLQHAQRVVNEPQAVLAAVPELRLRSPAHADHCCGSAGVYSLVEPELSRQVLDRKLATLEALAPDVVATANPGCIMQLGAGMLARGTNCPVLHPVELLDVSYQNAGYYSA